MSVSGHFLYFINLAKEALSFKDNEDFIYKIKNDFNFRLKIQKFVYIAKYFGWNHSYQYSLYIRGPYSSALADEYYNDDFLNYSPLLIEGFDFDSFNSFVTGKSISYLESASTILYFMNFKKNFSRQDSINKLYEIKPHIQSETVGRAYDDIIRFNFFKNNNFYEKVTIDENLDNLKEMSLSKINAYIDYFANFGQCNNSIIVSGSLDYLRIVLINENLNLGMKRDLLELFSSYILDVGFIHDICGGNPEVFKYLNLDYLENHFDRIQDYVSQELSIFPRLDDDEFDEIMG